MRKLFLILAAVASVACSEDTPTPNPYVVGEIEPNDTIATATQIPTDTTVVAALGTGADLDYYAFTVPAGGATIRIQTFDSSGADCLAIDPYVTVYNSAFNVIAYDLQSSGLGYCYDATLTLSTGGAYYVSVSTSSGAAFPYDVVVSIVAPTATLTESEPNDDGSVAAGSLDFYGPAADGPILGPTLVTGITNPSGDDDFFVVTNPHPNPATLHIETFTAWNGAYGTCSSIDTELDVLDAGGIIRANNDDHTGVGGFSYCSYLNYDLAAGETVYVRVTDYPDSGTNTGYLLLVDI
jgi:hypothetical protein